MSLDNFYIPKWLFGYFLFATTGVFTEIIFTAFFDNYFAVAEGGSFSWQLKGQSYVWMAFIYGPAYFLMNFFYPKVKGYHIILQLIFFAVSIFAVEYVTGFILDKLTGACPWEYHSQYAIHGYINLSYTPFWMLFGLFLVLLYNTSNRYKP
jgi:uncharacterized membrane protein